MRRRNALLVGLVLVLAAAGASTVAYPSLPLRVPTHWDLAGQVNGYSSRLFAASLMPAIAGVFWFLMLALPAISPRGFRLEQSAGAFYAGMLAVIAVLLAVHIGVLRAQTVGYSPPASLFFIPIGLLFIVLGILMGRLKKNFWIGVRTPWTLASDEVWARTHRFAGRLFLFGGIALVATSFAPNSAVRASVVIILFLAIVPIAYSYVIYRRIEGFGADEA